jgi:Protein of unknown function (DUF4231)
MATGQKGRQRAPKMQPLWERLEANIDWYDRKAKINQRAYKASKVAIILLAIAIPILAEYGALPGLHDTRALLVSIAAGAILLLEGLQQLNKWQENWILYRATCEGLRNEQHLFFEKAGPYANLRPEAAQRLLAGWAHSSRPSTPNGSMPGAKRPSQPLGKGP